MGDSSTSESEMLARDTSAEVEAIQIAGWRRMSSVEIANTIRSAWLAGQRIARIGLRERFPHATDHELQVRFAIQMLGLDLASRIHPDAARYSDI